MEPLMILKSYKLCSKNSDELSLSVITNEQTRLQERIKSIEQDMEALRALQIAERDERTQLSNTHRIDSETMRRDMWNVQREIEQSLEREIGQLQRTVDDVTARLSNQERELETYKNEIKRLDRASAAAKIEERDRIGVLERLQDRLKQVEEQGKPIQNRLNSLGDTYTNLKRDIEKDRITAERRFREIGKSKDDQDRAVAEANALIRSLEDRVSSCSSATQVLQIACKDQRIRLDAAMADTRKLREEMNKRIRGYVRRFFLLLAIAVAVFAISKFLGFGQPEVCYRPPIPQ
jgi:chromosome segregation ATPase